VKFWRKSFDENVAQKFAELRHFVHRLGDNLMVIDPGGIQHRKSPPVGSCPGKNQFTVAQSAELQEWHDLFPSQFEGALLQLFNQLGGVRFD
jgi:hypothetical protein